MTTMNKCRAGFTLAEILIVIAIIVALFAVLIPSVVSVMRKFDANKAKIQIEQLEAQIEEYSLAQGGYPTNEQGLFALVYIPDNVGGFQQPGMGQPSGMPGMDQSQQFEQSGGMFGGGASVGPTDFSTNMNQSGMQDMSGMGGGFDSTMGQMGNQMSMDGTMMSGSAWNQPIHNPQLYTQLRLRSVPYAKDAKQLIDPWKSPYRYDNSRDQYGLNPYTGEDRPAIWSAGRNKTDFDDDDIMNWVPAEAAQKRQEYMRQLQMRQQQMGGGMGDSMFGGGSAIGPSGMNDPTGFGGYGSGMPNMSPNMGGGQMNMPPNMGGGQMNMPPNMGGGQMNMSPNMGGGQMNMPPNMGGGQMNMPPNMGGGQFPPGVGGGQLPPGM